MEVEIISQENIKPSSPTPANHTTFKISIIDQLCANAYIPFLLFYPNNHQNPEKHVILATRNLLKQSLSQVLVRFYPLAGEIKNDDNLHVDCNDNGVYYVETEIKNQLPDFLKHPDTKLIRKLFPYDPDLVQFSGKTFVLAIQVNIFSCGGIAFGVFFTHKIMDGYSVATFLKSWADIALGSCNETINPSFDAPSVFPQNPTLSKHASLIVRPPSLPPPRCVPRLLFFDSSTLSELKMQASSTEKNASRVVSVVGLIWKSLISASSKRNGFRKTSVLSVLVNLRTRTSPPLPDFSIGNILWFATARFGPEKELELSSVIACLQNSIAEIDANFVKELTGDEGSLKMGERLRKLQEEEYSDEDAEYYCATSWCNLGFVEADFGFGKPSRILHGCPDSDNPGVANMILLNDFGHGDGIEALVSVSEDDMKIIEQDIEMLSFVSSSICFSH